MDDSQLTGWLRAQEPVGKGRVLIYAFTAELVQTRFFLRQVVTVVYERDNALWQRRVPKASTQEKHCVLGAWLCAYTCRGVGGCRMGWMSSAILQLVCWTYLPDLATRQVLSVLHQLLQRIWRIPPPPARSPVYVRHYRYTYAVVVLCYLAYSFVGASTSLPDNFYQLLGVDPQSDEGALKAAFRAFARKNHPDRTGPEGEALFIDVRDAFEALKNPVVRFAYDRFGPDVLHWQDCATMKDYLRRGLMSWLIRHVMTFAGLFLFSAVGRRSAVAAWRYLLFIGVFGVELYLIVAPSSSPGTGMFVDEMAHSTVLARLFPRHVTYQHILFLQQLFLVVSIAVSRVAPVLITGMHVDERGVVGAMGSGMGELSRVLERELWTMLDTEGLESLLLVREMEDIVVENRLRGELPMQSAWERAVGRRRARAMSL